VGTYLVTHRREITNRLKTLKDGIVYVLPEHAFDRLRKTSKPFEQYFIKAHGQRLLTERKANTTSDSDWSQQTVRSIVSKAPISLSSETTVQDAAKLMSQREFRPSWLSTIINWLEF